MLLVVEVGIEVMVLVHAQVLFQNWEYLKYHFHCDIFHAKYEFRLWFFRYQRDSAKRNWSTPLLCRRRETYLKKSTCRVKVEF